MSLDEKTPAIIFPMIDILDNQQPIDRRWEKDELFNVILTRPLRNGARRGDVVRCKREGDRYITEDGYYAEGVAEARELGWAVAHYNGGWVIGRHIMDHHAIEVRYIVGDFDRPHGLLKWVVRPVTPIFPLGAWSQELLPDTKDNKVALRDKHAATVRRNKLMRAQVTLMDRALTSLGSDDIAGIDEIPDFPFRVDVSAKATVCVVVRNFDSGIQEAERIDGIDYAGKPTKVMAETHYINTEVMFRWVDDIRGIHSKIEASSRKEAQGIMNARGKQVVSTGLQRFGPVSIAGVTPDRIGG